MALSPPILHRARLEAPQRGIIELAGDWRGRNRPPLALSPDGPAWATLTRVPDHAFGLESGYFVNRKGRIVFFLRVAEVAPDFDPAKERVFLSGDFNGWAGLNQPDWQLQPETLGGEAVLAWTGETTRFFATPPMRFKFVTSQDRWLSVPHDAPNAVRDPGGNVNRAVDPARTGQHLFEFTLAAPLDLSRAWSVVCREPGPAQQVPLMPGAFFFQLGTTAPLGAWVDGERTTFRVFAPRASRVELAICESLSALRPAGAEGGPAADAEVYRYPLRRRADGAWEVSLDQDLRGWFYWYHADGPRDAFGAFDPKRRILDPYALATVSREGPGVVVDRATLTPPVPGFVTPAWQDLVIAEVHVRDLAAQAPIPLTPDERRGFTGLRRWVESPDFYLHRLGINCVELQPVQENDALTPEEYHWGYMTVNFFAPASSYALAPERASQVREFRDLVAAFHARGMAVLVDVVYNHVGEPAHLMFLDRLYYFEQDAAGNLTNWSGCGNDLRAGAAMSRRLIIDSCRHFLEVFGVDGFRFDLAELLGVTVLGEIEVALKAVKPDVILIAEPWSFRGHIAGALATTGWASWNDGYRTFLRDFVRGGGSHESLEYFLKGSPWYFARWPAQTVNYVESHDDQTFLDVITENSDGNGHQPTANDRRRTHLMVAVLFMSIGIPMLSGGQDFLRSKHGVNNTYQRGDLNALDYRRAYRFPATHAYFADWIAFRRSPLGVLLRHYSRPSEGFFRFIFAPGSNAVAVVYNADRSAGLQQLLFAVNPTQTDVTISLGAVAERRWRLLADHERFQSAEARGLTLPVEPELMLPPFGCGLWISEG